MDRPLAVTANPQLLDALLKLAAVAGVELDVADEAAGARLRWSAAPLVVVGADLVDRLVGAALPRRPGVVLVGTDLDDASIWRRGVSVGAEHVTFLPDAEEWLVEQFAAAGERPAAARVVGVLGGRGGAGATTLAVALAIAAVRRGWQTLLVDADPMGGGIDLALGGENLPGPRWGDAAADHSLASALPRMQQLSVLAWGRDDVSAIPADAMAAAFSSARRGTDLVVLDLPRSLDDTTCASLARCSTVLLVVPAEVRATAAASRVAAIAARYVDDLRVVVRVPGPLNLDPHRVAASLGLPLAGVLRREPKVAEALERGEPPARRGALAQLAGAVLGDLLGSPVRLS